MRHRAAAMNSWSSAHPAGRFPCSSTETRPPRGSTPTPCSTATYTACPSAWTLPTDRTDGYRFTSTGWSCSADRVSMRALAARSNRAARSSSVRIRIRSAAASRRPRRFRAAWATSASGRQSERRQRSTPRSSHHSTAPTCPAIRRSWPTGSLIPPAVCSRP